MLFPLKSQRVNPKNALTMDSAKGKTGEKDCIFTMCGDETTTCSGRALKKRCRKQRNETYTFFDDFLGRVVN